jgi:four helix bundle protein
MENNKTEWKNIKPAHEKLWIWQKAHRLHIRIGELCRKLPRHEFYRLKDQIERSSKAVTANIAEGNESFYFEDKKKGLFTARKEVAETQNHLRDMEVKSYITACESQAMIDEYEEVKRGINGLVRTISAKKQSSGAKGANGSDI